ncbi:IS66-like element accessory protein TnpA [Acidisoma cladoniae]|jgi:transposase|uniref:IS66-like element accessory protein TnpA n=1 Tax=Acidisoma cladoniae TaxID=3040935 RepID=UPI002549CDC5|nr:transposase [Acidisoma sp. PAMC 29798]
MNTKKNVRRKIWPEALKREIVAAGSVPGVSVSVIGRQYNVNTNLVFTWRRQFTLPAHTTDAGFLPLVVQPEAAPSVAPSHVADAIEIELPRGYRLRVGSTTKASALRLVFDVLERR